MSEHTLWTNPSPTSAFSAGNVTLSDNISNYKFIGVRYKAVKSGEKNTIFYAKVDDWANMENIFRFSIFAIIGSVNYMRTVTYSSDTQIGFSTGTKVGASGTSNDNIIPIEVIGLK